MRTQLALVTFATLAVIIVHLTSEQATILERIIACTLRLENCVVDTRLTTPTGPGYGADGGTESHGELNSPMQGPLEYIP